MNISRITLAWLVSHTALFLHPGLHAAPTEVRIDLRETHQTWHGSGTCIAPWISSMVTLYNQESFQRIYTEEMGMNLLRIELMPEVHPQEEDPEAISFENFNLDSGGILPHANNSRARTYMNFAKAIRDLDPDAKVIGTAWSLPSWMKVNNNPWQNTTASENTLNPDYYEHAARWLIEWVKLYEAEGLDMFAVSFANEPRFSQTGFNSQVIDPAKYADALNVIGARFEEEGYGHILFFGPEDMTSGVVFNQQYLGQMRAKGSLQYLHAVASHGYTDGVATDADPDSATRLWALIQRLTPGKEFWITEGGTGGHSFDDSLDNLGAMLHHGLADGNVSLWTPWQVTDTSANEHGLMHGANFTPKSRAAQHYYRYIRPGATRVSAEPSGVDGSTPNVVSFIHPELNHLVTIVLNRTRQNQLIELKTPPSAGNLSWEAVQTTETAALAEVTLPNADEAGFTTFTVPARSITTMIANDIVIDTAYFDEGWVEHSDFGWAYGYTDWGKMAIIRHFSIIYLHDAAWLWDYTRETWVYYTPSETDSGVLYWDSVLGWLFDSPEWDEQWIYQYSSSDYINTSNGLPEA